MAAISMLLVVILACSGNAQIQSATGGEAKAKAPAAFTEVSFPLQHSLGKDAPFTLAGTFTARAYFDKSGTGAVKLTHPKLTRSPASKEDETAFSRLLEDNWLYRVRLPGNALHPTEASDRGAFAASFLPARCLAGVAFQEAWVLHTDAAGNLLALDYAPPGGVCPPEKEGVAKTQVPGGLLFRSASVAFRTSRDAPTLASTPTFKVGAAMSGNDEASPQESPLGGPEAGKEKPAPKYGMLMWVLGVQVLLHVMRGTVDDKPAGQKGDGKGGPQRPAIASKKE